jgi:hypothetical protein
MNLELTETVSPLKAVFSAPFVGYLAAVNMDLEISPKRRALREPRKMQLLFRNGIDITADNT